MTVQDKIKEFRLNMSLTQKQYRMTLIHLGLMLVALCVGIALSFSMGAGAVLVVLFAWFFLVLSLLDRLDIIVFRKTVDRKTKCVVCGRVSKRGDYDEDGTVVKSTVTNTPKGRETEKEITHEKTNPVPLEGLIIADKVICSDCVKAIGKVKWEV